MSMKEKSSCRVYENHSQDTRYKDLGDICQTVSATYGMGGNNQPLVVKEVYDAQRRHDYQPFGDICETVQANYGTGGNNVPMVNEREVEDAKTRDQVLRVLQETYGEKEVKEWGSAILVTLQQTEVLQQRVHESGFQCETEDGKELGGSSLTRPELVAEWLLRDMRKREECGRSSQGWKPTEQQYREFAEIMQKLPHESTQASKYLLDMWEKGQGLWILRETLSAIQEVRKPDDDKSKPIYRNAVVRRLTCLECTRLQGFPDGWVDIGDWVDSKGKKHKDADSPKYKALGNSIALPYWSWLADRIVKQLQEDGAEEVTMASLFDGIGGFPLVFQRDGAKPIWASEIEEFPIAVTKIRFPEGGNDETTNNQVVNGSDDPDSEEGS